MQRYVECVAEIPTIFRTIATPSPEESVVGKIGEPDFACLPAINNP